MAQSQSAEIYNHVFGQGDSPLMEQFCINNRFTPDQVRQAARAVLAEWQLTGVTHTDAAGRLDYSDAIRHLFNTMRYRLNDIVRRPKTREELRAELLGAAVRQMQDALENPEPYHEEEIPEEFRPF